MAEDAAALNRRRRGRKRRLERGLRGLACKWREEWKGGREERRSSKGRQMWSGECVVEKRRWVRRTGSNSELVNKDYVYRSKDTYL